MYMSKSSFSISDSFSKAWEAFKSHFADIMLAGIVVFFCSILIGVLGRLFFGSLPAQVIYRIVSAVLSAFLSIGLIKIGLGALRGGSTDLSQFQQPVSKAVKYVVASFMFSAVMLLGIICFIIPGVYFALRYQFVFVLIADKDVGILEAFAMSSQMTKGSKLDLFGLAIMNLVVNVLGFFALLIGLIVTIPVTQLAKLAAYQQLIPKVNKSLLPQQKKNDQNIFVLVLLFLIVVAFASVFAWKAFLQNRHVFQSAESLGIPTYPPSLSAGTSNPSSSTQLFYNWYLACNKAHLNCLDKLSLFAVDGSLASQFLPKRALDPIVCAQDMPRSVEVIGQSLYPSGNQATIYANGNFDSGIVTHMSVLTTKVNGAWKIQNVTCSK